MLYLSKACSVTITFTMDMITATNKADPKEAKPKLFAPTKDEVRLNMAPLITKVNKPKLKTFNGNDRMTKMGRTIPFRIESTKAAMSAVKRLAT